MRSIGRARFNPLHCGAVVASGASRETQQPDRNRFNPLHCGAVVASRNNLRAWRSGIERFNPLHCGAVVASKNGKKHARPRDQVSIPFIAGQWSLQEEDEVSHITTARFNPLHCGAVVASRIPSGSGPSQRAGFNPLHCGAVVASRQLGMRLEEIVEFQSPSLRGSGRFHLAIH